MKIQNLIKKNWKIFLLSMAVMSLQSGTLFAQQIRVVATWPAVADLTRQIGKELVSVESLATGGLLLSVLLVELIVDRRQVLRYLRRPPLSEAAPG